MSDKDTGGPAYPVTGYASSNGHNPPKDTWESGFGGMTLRDYFAATANIPWNVAFDSITGRPGSAVGGSATMDVEKIAVKMASMKYAMADAMIAERDKAE